MYDFLPIMIPILRTFVRAFGISSSSLRNSAYDHLAHSLLSYRYDHLLRSFAYELLAYDLFLYEHFLTIFRHMIVCPIRSFSGEHLAYDLFLHQLLLTIFRRTIFCRIRTFVYQHLLKNFWHTNICPHGGYFWDGPRICCFIPCVHGI